MYAESVSLARVIDDACGRILKAWQENRRPTTLKVHPLIYQALAGAKGREVDRGLPLLLLGMDVYSSEGVPPEEPDLF